MNFGPEHQMRVSAAISSFDSKAEMNQFAPNFLRTFY